MTLREQIIRGLERMGYRREPRRDTAKRVVFSDPRRDGFYIYVGKFGSVRSGANMRDSVSLDGLKAKALAAGLPAKEPVT